MKRIYYNRFICFLSIIAIGLFLSSCKKESVSNNNADDHNYISFKSDGVEKEYASNSFATFSPADTSGIYMGFMGAYQNTVGSDQPQISLLLMSEAEYTAGQVFQDPLKTVTHGGVKEPQVIITYLEFVDPNGFQSLGLFSELVGQPGYLEHTVADAKATITEITASYVKGTFSATVFKSDDPSLKRVITDGKFYLKRII